MSNEEFAEQMLKQLDPGHRAHLDQCEAGATEDAQRIVAIMMAANADSIELPIALAMINDITKTWDQDRTTDVALTLAHQLAMHFHVMAQEADE